MSGNRANAAAINRRTNTPQSSVAPPGGARQVQQQGQRQQTQGQQFQGQQFQGQGQRQGQQRQGQQTQGQQIPQPQVQPKMSISDAIGLLSLRLGRVETYIQQMPPLDELNMGVSSNGGSEVGENMRVVDEAVFTNIVARLEKMEQTQRTTTQTVVQQSMPLPSLSPVSNEKYDELFISFELLKAETAQLKDLLLSLQSFTMTTNQKLSDIVFSNDINDMNEMNEMNEINGMNDINELVEGSQMLDGFSDLELNIQTDDSEILTTNIDLKSFVESSV